MTDSRIGGVPTHALKIALVVLLALGLFIPVATASSHDFAFMADCAYEDVLEVVECTFLPQDATLAEGDTKKLFFGIVLPFVLVFAIFRLGLKKALGSEGETDIIALVLALFVIPSGGYRYISELFLAIGGLGDEGFDETRLLAGVEPWQQQLLIVGSIAIILSVIIMYRTKSRTIKKHEFMLIGAISLMVWIALGGLQYVTADQATQATGQVVGMIIVGLIGLYLLYVFLRAGGGVGGTIIGFIGLMILAWVLASLPSELGMAQDLGEMVLQSGSALLMVVGGLIFIFIVILILGASGGGGARVGIALIIVAVIAYITFTYAAALLNLVIPLIAIPRKNHTHKHRNLYKRSVETST